MTVGTHRDQHGIGAQDAPPPWLVAYRTFYQHCKALEAHRVAGVKIVPAHTAAERFSESRGRQHQGSWQGWAERCGDKGWLTFSAENAAHSPQVKHVWG